MSGEWRAEMLDKLDALNEQLVANGFAVTIGRRAAEALTDDDLAEAVRDVGHALVRGNRVLGEQ